METEGVLRRSNSRDSPPEKLLRRKPKFFFGLHSRNITIGNITPADQLLVHNRNITSGNIASHFYKLSVIIFYLLNYLYVRLYVILLVQVILQGGCNLTLSKITTVVILHRRKRIE